MATSSQAQEGLTKRGVHALTNEEGVAGFELALRFGRPQVAYFAMEGGYQPDALFAHRTSSFEKVAASDAQPVPAAIRQALSGGGDVSLDNGSLVAWVQQKVIAQIADSLRIDPAEVLPEEDFNDLGLDSLLVVEIIGALEKELKVAIAPTLLFQYPTTAKLTEHLVQAYGADLKAGLN